MDKMCPQCKLENVFNKELQDGMEPEDLLVLLAFKLASISVKEPRLEDAVDEALKAGMTEDDIGDISVRVAIEHVGKALTEAKTGQKDETGEKDTTSSPVAEDEEAET